jgi:hypothetical protein
MFVSSLFAKDDEIEVMWRQNYIQKIDEKILESKAFECRGWSNFRKWLDAQVMLQIFPAEIKANEEALFIEDAGVLASLADINSMISFFYNAPIEKIKEFTCKLPEVIEVNPTATYVYIYNTIWESKPNNDNLFNKTAPSGNVYILNEIFN